MRIELSSPRSVDVKCVRDIPIWRAGMDHDGNVYVRVRNRKIICFHTGQTAIYVGDLTDSGCSFLNTEITPYGAEDITIFFDRWDDGG